MRLIVSVPDNNADGVREVINQHFFELSDDEITLNQLALSEDCMECLTAMIVNNRHRAALALSLGAAILTSDPSEITIDDG